MRDSNCIIDLARKAASVWGEWKALHSKRYVTANAVRLNNKDTRPSRRPKAARSFIIPEELSENSLMLQL